MKNLRKSVLAASIAAAISTSSAMAADTFTTNVGVTSDYRFRGISQSARDPALQGGADFVSGSGFYLSAWGSTIDFDGGPGLDPDADLEVDLYGGYKWKVGGVEWDVGLIHYAYPGSDGAFDLPFTELFFGGTFGPAFAKFFYTDDYTGTTSKSASYLTAGANLDLGNGYTLGLSAGRSSGGGIKDTFGKNYNDYKVGVSKDFAGITFNLSYVDTSGITDITSDVFNSEGTVVLTVSKTF